MVKDLLVDNIDGHVIYFCDEAARIVRPDTKNKHRPVVGMPVISVKLGDHCYHGLCDMGASSSAIPHSLYEEIMHDIAPAEIEDIDVTIKLANRDTISPIGIVRYVDINYQNHLGSICAFRHGNRSKTNNFIFTRQFFIIGLSTKFSKIKIVRHIPYTTTNNILFCNLS